MCAGLQEEMARQQQLAAATRARPRWHRHWRRAGRPRRRSALTEDVRQPDLHACQAAGNLPHDVAGHLQRARGQAVGLVFSMQGLETMRETEAPA